MANDVVVLLMVDILINVLKSWKANPMNNVKSLDIKQFVNNQ